MWCGIICGEQAFKEQAGKEPVWKVIQADHTLYLPSGTLIIPGACPAAVKKPACKIFAQKYAGCIDAAAEGKGEMLQDPKQRTKQTGAAIDGKHPQGGLSHQGHISLAQGIKGGESNFKAPSRQPAFKKVFKKCFYHIYSMW